MLEKLALKDKLWRNVAFKFTCNKSDADELVQNMYLRVLDYKVNLDDKNDNFFKVVLYNLFKDSKKNKKEICYHFFTEKYSDENIEDLMIKKETINQVTKNLKKLNLIYQEVIDLKYFQGLSYKEICLITNQKMSNVKLRLYRAKKQLKEIQNN